MSEEWAFRYRCRQCGMLEHGARGSKKNVNMLFTHIVIGKDPADTMGSLKMIGSAPELMTTHVCSKDHVGIADLVGICKSE